MIFHAHIFYFRFRPNNDPLLIDPMSKQIR